MSTNDKILMALAITTGVLTVKEIRDTMLRKSKGKVVAMDCGDHPLPHPFDSMSETIEPFSIKHVAPLFYEQIVNGLK